jgi:hypothetical protein
LDRSSGDRSFAGSSAADEDRHPAKVDEDLWGATRNRIGSYCGAEHLHVPISRRPRIFADDVDVIEPEGWIAHRVAY